MWKRISSFLSGIPLEDKNDLQTPSDKHVAAAALLIEVAYMDEEYELVERNRIGELVQKSFCLDADARDALMEQAEAVALDSTQLYKFTRVINDTYSPEERVDLMESLWEVVYADGEIHEMEAGLLRKIGGLIYVSDKDRGLARQRVIERRASGRS